MKWEPIESAPKDGTEILVYVPEDFKLYTYIVAYWGCEYLNGKPNEHLGYMWIYRGNREGGSLDKINPTHWTPITKPQS